MTTVDELLHDIDRENAEELQRRADAIVLRIAITHEERWTIDESIAELAEWVTQIFPEKVWLFDAIYRRRFERVWDQTRTEWGED